MPAQPFYPEGVVLTLLTLAAEGDTEDADHAQAINRLLTPGTELKQIESEAALTQLSQEMVNDIATFPTVPAVPSSVQSGEFLPTTSVCVELAQLSDPTQLRWVIFTLRYQPPDLESRLPDRWTVSGVGEMPSPATASAGSYCESILAQPAQ